MKPHIGLLAMAFTAACKLQAAECHNITDIINSDRNRSSLTLWTSGFPLKDILGNWVSRYSSSIGMALDGFDPSFRQIRKLLRISTAVCYRLGPKLEGVGWNRKPSVLVERAQFVIKCFGLNFHPEQRQAP